MRKDHNEFGYSYVLNNCVITVGSYTYGANNIEIYDYNTAASLTIGKFCSISENVRVILAGEHRHRWVTTYPFGPGWSENDSINKWREFSISKGPVVVGNDVLISNGVTILSGVTIGDGAIIGANSLITKDVGPYEIVGGNPAKLIRKRFSQEMINLLLELQWWNFEPHIIQNILNDLCKEPSIEALQRLIRDYK